MGLFFAVAVESFTDGLMIGTGGFNCVNIGFIVIFRASFSRYSHGICNTLYLLKRREFN
jgi:hypothetical protein